MIGWFAKLMGGVSVSQVVAVVALAIGMGIGFTAGKLIFQGRALRAEKAVLEVDLKTSKAIIALADKSTSLGDLVRSALNEQNKGFDAVAGDIRDLRRAVRVCTSLSAMQVARPAPGADEEVADGQPRPAEDVLQDIAADSALAADSNAAAHNALVDWYTGLKKSLE
jgi:hypothetical protein